MHQMSLREHIKYNQTKVFSSPLNYLIRLRKLSQNESMALLENTTAPNLLCVEERFRVNYCLWCTSLKAWCTKFQSLLRNFLVNNPELLPSQWVPVLAPIIFSSATCKPASRSKAEGHRAGDSPTFLLPNFLSLSGHTG